MLIPCYDHKMAPNARPPSIWNENEEDSVESNIKPERMQKIESNSKRSLSGCINEEIEEAIRRDI